jgi:hypothetical protein
MRLFILLILQLLLYSACTTLKRDTSFDDQLSSFYTHSKFNLKFNLKPNTTLIQTQTKATSYHTQDMNKPCKKSYMSLFPLSLSLAALGSGLAMNYMRRSCLQVNEQGQCLSDRPVDTLWLNLTLIGGVGSVVSYAHYRKASQQVCLFTTTQTH